MAAPPRCAPLYGHRESDRKRERERDGGRERKRDREREDVIKAMREGQTEADKNSQGNEALIGGNCMNKKMLLAHQST